MNEVFHSDPANYRKMSEPFPSREVANEKITRFNEMVSAARRECGIREVLVVVAGGIINGEEEGEYITSFSFGRGSEIPTLAAYALGEARAFEQTPVLVDAGREEEVALLRRIADGIEKLVEAWGK